MKKNRQNETQKTPPKIGETSKSIIVIGAVAVGPDDVDVGIDGVCIVFAAIVGVGVIDTVGGGDGDVGVCFCVVVGLQFCGVIVDGGVGGCVIDVVLVDAEVDVAGVGGDGHIV
ncbi:Hypothetical predicted protein [Octopus vulgaris]|uniref:Uncharacterized protein n=1 Tax=Octopus vulgaris TaxID=6645 RepID=A0AA36ALC7_OCTVU|nr:Hypothetical predicted protein [Octopus vulgaris]